MKIVVDENASFFGGRAADHDLGIMQLSSGCILKFESLCKVCCRRFNSSFCGSGGSAIKDDKYCRHIVWRAEGQCTQFSTIFFDQTDH